MNVGDDGIVVLGAIEGFVEGMAVGDDGFIDG